MASTALATLTRKCSVNGCSKEVFCKGFCNPHYQKNLIYGNPLGSPVLSKVYTDDHGYSCMSVNGKKVRMHILVAEKALGKKIPKGASVHHIDENKTNYRSDNLVICQNEAYHQLLHRRQRALNESGNANNRQCVFCKNWDDEKSMKVNKANSSSYHSACRNASRREIYHNKMREAK